MLLVKRTHKLFSLNANRSRTLRANFLWNAVGSAVFTLCQWGVLILFAKLGSPTIVGQLVYGLAITTPLFIVAGLQLRSIHATDAGNRHTLGQYIGLRALSTAAALVVAVIVAVALWTVGSQLALIILLWALAKTIDSGSDCLYGLFQKAERMDYVGVSLAARGVLGCAGVIIAFRASHSALLALAGLVIAWLTVFIVFDAPAARILVRSTSSVHISGSIERTLASVFNRRRVTALFREASPLGIVAFLLAIQVQLPRYVVAGLLHTYDLGLFSAAAYFTIAGAMLVNALGAPACVRLAKYHVDGAGVAFRQLMTKLLIVAAGLGIAGVLVSALAGRFILALCYTREYSGMAPVLTVLCAASALSYIASFLGYAMTAARRYKVQVPLFVSVLIITALSCYLLTEQYGLMGTAIGILVGNLSQLMFSAAVVWGAAGRDFRRSHLASHEMKDIAESLP